VTSADQARDRELLLHKNELALVKKGLNVRGNTAVVLDIVLERNKIKVRFAVAKGKKMYDKRSKLKELDQKRDIDRDLKHYDMIK
jgi:SsrA-binding protein